MHLKLQNFKSVNMSTWSCKSIPPKSLLWIDAPEVAKYQKCKWVQFYTWCTWSCKIFKVYMNTILQFFKSIHNYNYVGKGSL